MEAMFAAASILVATILIIVLYRIRHSNPSVCLHLPPLVPGGLPFLGNILDVDRTQPHLTLTEWAKRHGNIFRFRLLMRDVIVLNASDVVHDALVTKETQFAGRPTMFRIQYGFHYTDDVIFGTFSPKWLDMKRRTTAILRRFTSGERHVDGAVAVEMRELVESLRVRARETDRQRGGTRKGAKRGDGAPEGEEGKGQVQELGGGGVDISLFLQTAVFNAISASVLGRRYQHDDQVMTDYKHVTRLFSEACSPVNGVELDLFPWLRFFTARTVFRKLHEARTILDEFVDKELEIVKENYDTGTEPRCLLEGLLKLRDDDAKTSNVFAITNSDVRNMYIDILVGATLTTSVALNTFVLLVSRHDDIQAKLHQELDENIGRERLPTLEDRQYNHFMEAAILETLRYISHIPLSLPHCTTSDTTLAGYDIAKGTTVLINLWNVHHDATVWTDPWSFRPERFLDESGRLIPTGHTLRKSLMPFGQGRRKCIGETMTLERLFLFASGILQNFVLLSSRMESMQKKDIIDDTNKDNDNSRDKSALIDPACDPRAFNLGLILEPKPFGVKIVCR